MILRGRRRAGRGASPRGSFTATSSSRTSSSERTAGPRDRLRDRARRGASDCPDQTIDARPRILDDRPSARFRAVRLALEPPHATGSCLGTPGYMAPEQYLSATSDIDARADIFAFCAALYRALYGQRPFEGTRSTRSRRETLNGKVRECPPKGTDVPALVHGACSCGGSRSSAGRAPRRCASFSRRCAPTLPAATAMARRRRSCSPASRSAWVSTSRRERRCGRAM